MKRTGFKTQGEPIKRTTRVNPVSKKRKAERKSRKGQDAIKHMARVKELPCVVCGAYGVDVHHCMSGRYGSRKASDFETIPLCPRHHRHEYGPSAYHYSKAAWELEHGPDHGFIARTRKTIEGMS